MPGPDLFIVQDLHDQKYLPAVLHNIHVRPFRDRPWHELVCTHRIAHVFAQALAKLYDTRASDKPAATTEHAKKLASRTPRSLDVCLLPAPNSPVR